VQNLDKIYLIWYNWGRAKERLARLLPGWIN